MFYTWIFVTGCFASWFFGWGTGANDVANAFGTSVGSKTLTMGQAVLLAVIFEFTGAMVLGTVATSTLQGGIAKLGAFQREPEFYAYGMLCAMFVSGLWQAICSYLELNASSTHSIIGSILGFALVYKGDDAVIWLEENKEAKAFPYRGILPIVVSWFISPIATGIVAGLIFIICRHTVLRSKDSFSRTFWALPPLVLLTVFASVYFVITKGAAKSLQENNPRYKNPDKLSAFAAWVAAATGGGCALIVAVLMPLLKKRAAARMAAADEELEAQKAGVDLDKAEPVPWAEQSTLQKVKSVVFHGVSQDIHKIVDEDPLVGAIHQRAEVFDPKTEYAFSYLQVFSAVCVIFAHGANDSAYMVGPLAGIYQVWKTGTLGKAQHPPIWIVVIGASGLVVGLATYGYNVTRAMGTRMAKLSPSRGFAAELATAITILLLSQYGLPNSSSQCITGAIVGVGLFGGLDFGAGRSLTWDTSGVNWIFFLKTFTSWVFTLIVCGLGTAALFAQGAFAPSVQMGRTIVQYEDGINNISSIIVKSYNASVRALPGTIPATLQDTTTNFTAKWAAVEKQANNYKKWYTGLKGNGTVAAGTVLGFLKSNLGLVNNNTVSTVGFNVEALNTTAGNSLSKFKVV